MLSVSGKFEVCTIFFFDKKKNITVNLDISASHLSKEKSSARCFSPNARAVVVVTSCLRPSWRHGFCQHSIFLVFLKVLLYSFSSWMIISPSWKKSFGFVIKGMSSKTVWQKLILNWAHRKRIVFDIFLRRSHPEQDCPCMKKLEDVLQIKLTNNRWLKLVEVCSMQNYFQCETFPLTFIWEMQMRLT